MKPFAILSTIMVAVLSVSVSFGEDNSGEGGLVKISTDSIVNGFIVENLDVLPFSPIIEPTFNLPDTCVVNVLITDTLLSDTAWIVKDRIISPGLYKITYGAFGNYTNSTGNRIIKLHIEARLRTADSGVNVLENWHHAIYLLHLP